MRAGDGGNEIFILLTTGVAGRRRGRRKWLPNHPWQTDRFPLNKRSTVLLSKIRSKNIIYPMYEFSQVANTDMK